MAATSGVRWRPDHATFLVDDGPVGTVQHTPDYPLQLILGVFDFPDRAPNGQNDVPVPELIVRRVTGRVAPAG